MSALITQRHRALFVDRDGVLNRVIMRGEIMSSPRSWSEVREIPELLGLEQVKGLGYQLILVTNQPDLERGLVAPDFVHEFHETLRRRHRLDAIYMCPYSDNSHPMKKPNPGMFLKAAEERALDLSQCIHLGDTDRDVVAAARVGCKSVLWDQPYNQSLHCDYRAKSLADLMHILGRGAQP